MSVSRFVFPVTLAAAQCVSGLAWAFDLTGAWAQDRNQCAQVFARTDRAIVFGPNSELWGKGFIVEGNAIRGQAVRCTIRSKREKDTTINLLASCASDIMVDQVQFTFRTDGNDSITRIFPGIDGLEVTYVRCSL
jgi:hypothetical protein